MREGILVLITTLANIFTLVIFIDIILSWILSPFHPLRMAIGRILQPIYGPIRRIIPPIGMMDVSPIILLLLVQVIERIAISLLS
jgi:YggT family protein